MHNVLDWEKPKFKGDTWADPKIYLGAKIESKSHNGVKLWTMGSREYLKATIAEVELNLHIEGRRIQT